MKLDLKRYAFTPECTLGELSVDGEKLCYTLEDAYRETEEPVAKWKIYGKTAIPKGTYIVQITFSNRFKKDLPLLLDVPGFSGIRIHAGNTDKDTEGCILVGGKPTGDKFVPNSRATMQKVMTLLENAELDGETISITIG